MTAGDVLLPPAQEAPPDSKPTKMVTSAVHIVTMLACAIVAVVGLRIFVNAPTMIGTPDDAKPAGYGSWDVVGLAAWFYLAPAVAVLAFTLTFDVMNHPASPKFLKILWTLVGAVVSFTLAAMSWAKLAQDVLSCGVIFCAGDAGREDIRPAGNFYNSVGLGLFVLFAGVGVSFTSVLFRLFVNGRSEVREIQLKPLQATIHARKLRRFAAAMTLAIVILPACLILTAILPTSFQGFQSENIATFMASEVVDAELPRAWMTTLNWKWSESVVLKLYPDTLLFYGFLEVLVLGAIGSAIFAPIGKFFARPVHKGVTVGECFVGSLCFILVVAWVFYWMHDHQYHSGKADMDPIWSERIARTCGMTAVLFMSLCLLPASKNSLWLQALGISWESSIWLHRWLGGFSIIWAIAHVISFWVRYSELDIMPHDMLALVPFYPLNFAPPTIPKGDNWTMGMMQLIAYPSFFLIGLPHFWRKRNWEIFKYLHFIFLALIPATLIHGASSWFFLLGGIAFYVVDALLRFVSTASPCPMLSANAYEAEGGVTELTFEKAFSEPGQYCFVNIPAISRWEWHPFSLCSSPLDGSAQMHIKNMGQGTFTGRLFEHVKATGAPLMMNVDGPYGPPLDPSDHAAMVLIAGGIGITPIHSTFRMLSQLAKKGQLPNTLKYVRLIWIGRSVDLFSILAPSVRDCLDEYAMPASAPLFRATFYVDNPRDANPAGAAKDFGVPVEVGRPNMSELLDEVVQEYATDATALVQCCGPPPMANAVEKLVSQKPTLEYQSELFAL